MTTNYRDLPEAERAALRDEARDADSAAAHDASDGTYGHPLPEPPALNLPAPIGNAQGAVDVDALAALLPTLRRDLVGAISHAAVMVRAERGTVVTPEDTYDLVRRLTHAGEVLRQVAEAFIAGAKETDALLEEEATIALGEQDGIPLGTLFVPDGVGQRIAVRTEYGTEKDAWDTASLTGWLVEDTVATIAAEVDDGTWNRGDAELAGRKVAERLLALGNFVPKVTEVEKLRTQAAELGDDETARTLGQLRTKGGRVYKGTKITREPTPKSKR